MKRNYVKYGVETMKFKVPKKILGPEEIKRLSPSERDYYIQNVILEILEMNKRGVTVSQVSQRFSFSRPTIAKHLDILVAIGEAYVVQRGNLSIYYKNGKIVHEEDVQSMVVSSKAYTFYKLKNQEGEFLYIQEKDLDEFRSPRVKGGILINAKDIPPFMGALEKFIKKGEVAWLKT